ncbi:molybdenum cofactor guanylyltransferase [Desulforamulus hydrothermalis]|uniref:Probable molybdenum cofactor guanylyltransferase n=1 Tax=Desulforamulus hydrothermalis Lam5 = DSM 18033 TaxID=1121428 RepID=K8EBE8_9FIRM|nr:molybdenum cofactor guanylyltransferase [Desulforamulus hydrothermalis]CCO08968.1 putative molybdopterin-guanine dinucleotide biosynthesis protein A [Desulforamulus hydrothermalis Lam5 = DSM 18033]SHG75924.1 molybdenum cofactor guanylyltransferase [Desulforamulus hydrothermalis Lam5 = DSM 18033]
MTDQTNFAAVILAGGSSRRMQTNKALLQINGKSIMQIIIDRLTPYFKEVIIISNQPQVYARFGLPVYSDIFLNQGPLAGIHSGLTHISSAGAFFTACDMPFIDPRLAWQLTQLLHSYQGVVPRLGAFLQPLYAAYSKECLPAVEKSLQNGQPKITSFYQWVNINYFDFAQHPEYNWDRIFFNVNTPSDYQQITGIK